MKKIVMATLCLALFTGCGKVYYSSTGRTAGQFEMDKARCMNFANGAYGSQMPYPTDTGNNQYNVQGYTSNGTYYNGTVTQKPTYQQEVNNLGNSLGNMAYAINKDRAFEACMNNFGWYPQ